MLKALQDALRTRVTAAIGLRDLTSSNRAGMGESPLAIVTCLGPGRCHIPDSEGKGITCPFCVEYQGSRKDLDAHMRRVVGGN